MEYKKLVCQAKIVFNKKNKKRIFNIEKNWLTYQKNHLKTYVWNIQYFYRGIETVDTVAKEEQSKTEAFDMRCHTIGKRSKLFGRIWGDTNNNLEQRCARRRVLRSRIEKRINEWFDHTRGGLFGSIVEKGVKEVNSDWVTPLLRVIRDD